MRQAFTALTASIFQATEVKLNDSIEKDVYQEIETSAKDPFHQLEGFQLFAYFTANIIQEDVTFTR